MKAIVISIGDELLLGQTLDSNSAWLSEQLSTLGIRVTGHITVGDDRAQIVQVLRQAAERAELIIASGGLGPTEDDLTRYALAEVMNTDFKLDTQSLEQIEDFFRRMKRPMPRRNRIQAMIPKGAEPLANTLGTAPGIVATVGKAVGFFMPGVPSEMRKMFLDAVRKILLPMLAERVDNEVVQQRTLHTIGVGESDLAELLGNMMSRGKNPLINTTVSYGIVSIRIVARADTAENAQALIEPVEKELRRCLGSFLFGCDEQSLADVITTLLRKRKNTLAIAESCTGGLLSKTLTDIPGASEFLQVSWVTYSDRAKIRLLNVNPDLIQQYGAVSEPVARAMAREALKLAKTDYAVSITGIAGPGGATQDKPVGLVYLALAAETGVNVYQRIFPGDRTSIRMRAVNTALDMLRHTLLPLQVDDNDNAEKKDENDETDDTGEKIEDNTTD